MNTPPSSSSSAAPVAGHGAHSILWLLGAIVCGVLLGASYGQSMWLSSDEPAKAIKRIDEILQQKQELLKGQAENPVAPHDKPAASPEKLKTQIETLKKEQERLIDLRAQGDAQSPAAKHVAGGSYTFLKFLGETFLRMLKCLVLPLVFTSMVCGITSLGDVRAVGRLGSWTLIYFLLTTGLAVFIGLTLVTVLKPGKQADDTFAYTTSSAASKQKTSTLETLLSVVRGHGDDPGGGMFPENIFSAALTNNVMGLIVFSLVLGGTLSTLGETGQPAIRFFNALNEALLGMVHLVMKLAPLGIFGLLAASIARRGGGSEFLVELARLGVYSATVISGLLLHAVLLLVILRIFSSHRPLQFLSDMLQAIITSVSTASSSATLPVTLQCAEENAKISPTITRFVVPLGATVNMNGTALYEAVAAVFIAQSLGIELSVGELVVVMLTATLAAVGAAGIPEAGLVTMVMVLGAVGLPIEGIGTILAIDWFLDRLRTCINIFGDVVGAAVLEHYLGAPASKVATAKKN
ncbi:MAG: dicarboxylate/amino acid:cation symporter [Planctomycetaceae bacterium]